MVPSRLPGVPGWRTGLFVGPRGPRRIGLVDMTMTGRIAALEAPKVSVEGMLRRDRAVARAGNVESGMWNMGFSEPTFHSPISFSLLLI